MIAVQQTETFAHWLSSLKDRSGLVRILSRLDRIAMGNFGDVKPVGRAFRKSGSIRDPDTACISSARRTR